MAELTKGRWRLYTQVDWYTFSLGIKLHLQRDFGRECALEIFLGPLEVAITVDKYPHRQIGN